MRFYLVERRKGFVYDKWNMSEIWHIRTERHISWKYHIYCMYVFLRR